jgi:hypothetical protein
MNQAIVVELTLAKSTTTTHVYGSDNAGIRGLYLPKALLGPDLAANPPAKLKMTLEVAS